MVSTLEALPVLVALKLYHSEQPRTHQTNVMTASTRTDNRGTGTALNKFMTTKFTASAVLMEMTALYEAHGHEGFLSCLHVEATQRPTLWPKRYTMRFRMPVSVEDIVWDVLPSDFQAAKKKGARPDSKKFLCRRKPEKILRVVDPNQRHQQKLLG